MTQTPGYPSHPPFAGRVEDDPLLRGAGRFVGDAPIAGQAFGAFIRSPHAHARVRALDAEKALALPGVLAVLRHVDVSDLDTINSAMAFRQGRTSAPFVSPHRPALAERAMHVGDPVAMVVAKRAAIAADAAELVAVDYEVLPAVADARTALAAGAPQLWNDVPGNLASDWSLPADPAAHARVEAILQTAPRVVRRTIANQRIAGMAMEPRGGTASYDAETGRYTFRGCSQGAGALAGGLAKVMNVAPEMVRVLSDDVGGGFGIKTNAYPEYAAMLVAARKLGRPVHWMSSRAESFLSDHQARDNVSEVALALDENGRFLALKVEAVTNLGAYATNVGSTISTSGFALCFAAMYDIPAISVSVRLAYTNSVPVGPYRGAGRPESNYVTERIVDAAARDTGIDPLELRRRNFIPPDAMPYRTALGRVIDTGDFANLFEAAQRESDLAGFAARRRASAADGKLRGRGIACFMEHSGGRFESVVLRFEGERVVVRLGMQASGQGHRTVFRDLVAERLALPPEAVTVVAGDSDFRIEGWAAIGSRSTMTAGPALASAVDMAVAKGKKVASQLLEASEADIQYAQGRFEVVGTDRSVRLFEVAEKAAAMTNAREIDESLDTTAGADGMQTFPNGCHIAEVELDPETGSVAIVGYTAVDDIGTVLNHTMAEGQVAGGIAQGIGQALLEIVRYDEDGQVLTGSFMDYAMPRAENVPRIAASFHPVPTTNNFLGIKGVGEAGTTAAIGAVMNAIMDALPPGKGRSLQMPATPEAVWRACRG